jgi:hypothetical protein
MNAENIITIIALIIMSAALYLAFKFGFQEKQEIDAMLIKHPECTMATRPRACLKYNLKLERLLNDMEND